MCFFFPLALFLSLSQPCCWCMCACVCASVWKRTKYKTKLQWHSSNQLYYVHHPVVALGREQPKTAHRKTKISGHLKKKKTQIYSAHLGAFHHVHHLSSRGFSRWHIHITFYLTDFLSLHRTPFFFFLTNTHKTDLLLIRTFSSSFSHNNNEKILLFSVPFFIFLSVLMTKLIFIFSLTTTSFSGFLEMFEPLRRRHLTWFFPPIPRCIYPLILTPLPPILTYYVVLQICMMTRFDYFFTIWLFDWTKTDWKPKLACTVVLCECVSQWDGRIHWRWHQTEGGDSDRLPRRCLRCPGPRPSPCPTGIRSWNPGLRWAGLRFTYHSTLARRYPFRFHKKIVPYRRQDFVQTRNKQNNRQLYTQTKNW